MIFSIPFRLLLFLSLILAFGSADAQMLLSLEKPGTGKRFRYYTGDAVKFTLSPGNRIVEGVITSMNDTGMVINRIQVIRLDQVTQFHRQRYFPSSMSPVLWTAGGSYLLIDVVNRLINDDHPVIPEETLLTSAILGAAGALAIPFHYTSYPIGDKWKLKILNLSE